MALTLPSGRLIFIIFIRYYLFFIIVFKFYFFFIITVTLNEPFHLMGAFFVNIYLYHSNFFLTSCKLVTFEKFTIFTKDILRAKYRSWQNIHFVQERPYAYLTCPDKLYLRQKNYRNQNSTKKVV